MKIGMFGALVLGGLVLAGCGGQAPPPAAVMACQVDAVLQPAAVALAPLAGPVGEEAAAIDTALAHPIVRLLCDALTAPPAKP